MNGMCVNELNRDVWGRLVRGRLVAVDSHIE